TIMGLLLHASATMPDGGGLLIETGTVALRAALPYTMLALTYTGLEPDPDRLFEPSSMEEDGMALSMIHAIVTEHGGYLSAHPTECGGSRLEALSPGLTGAVAAKAQLPRPELTGAATVLYVDPRDHMRLELHNFFEKNGYNLLEAADRDEAIAISQMH